MENKFTPESLSATNKQFTIPLYQRLFEWDKKEIRQLLKDLYQSFEKDRNQPYYIGMLTVYEEDAQRFSLVDGQQRFTVLTLIALAFRGEKWQRFLTTEHNEKRLTFFARKKDSEYLTNKIENVAKDEYVNRKMEAGIAAIREYVDTLGELKDDFQDYVFKYTTFFISALPKEYAAPDLNRYFEAMNAAGRSLENHEILKVNLLKCVEDEDQEFYTTVWNAISQMDKCLIRPDSNKEKAEDYRQRVSKALGKLNEAKELFGLCNQSTNKSSVTIRSIKDIPANGNSPSKGISSSNERAILSFSDFLLQVLWLELRQEERGSTADFFNVHKLQQTFEKHLLKNDLPGRKTVCQFLDNLLKYRILFDQFVLRVSHTDQNSSSYFLEFSGSDSEKEALKRLLQFQSMLYVSTSSHLWLSKTLIYLEANAESVSPVTYLNELKRIDNERLDKNVDLSYGKIDRYWFWRLDYYLWENRAKVFNEKSIDIANRYIFRTNRSIEHVAPQRPNRETAIKMSDNNLLHSFGNLAMISAGQNSSLQNETYEVKRAHVESFINGRGGSIESLKMLKIYEYSIWSEENIQQHANEMIQILIESFPSDNNAYAKVINFLKEKLYDVEMAV